MFGLMIAVALSMLLPNVSEAAAKKPAAVKATRAPATRRQQP